MRAGRMRNKIRVEKATTTKNIDSGVTSNIFTAVVARKCLITEKSGKEVSSDAGEYSKSTVVIELRYERALADINAEWRLVDVVSGRIYDIENIPPISSTTKFLKIACSHRSR